MVNCRGMEMAVVRVGGFGPSGITNTISYCHTEREGAGWRILSEVSIASLLCSLQLELGNDFSTVFPLLKSSHASLSLGLSVTLLLSQSSPCYHLSNSPQSRSSRQLFLSLFMISMAVPQVPHIECCNFGVAVLHNQLYILGGCFR